MAEEHRRELSTLSGAERPLRLEQKPIAATVDVLLPANGYSPHPGRSVDRSLIGQHVGTLLIRVGTRLGGGPSMRTS
jgi:hypothetical protein